jgi:hypothetical protein
MSQIKRIKYTYRGMNQDVTLEKHSREFYYSAKNIRIMATTDNTSGSVSNELGNSLALNIPNVTINTIKNTVSWDGDYGGSVTYYQGNLIPEIEQQVNTGILNVSSYTQKIIGHATTRDSIILFTTDEGTNDNSQMDCVWELKEIFNNSHSLNLLYCRNLGFSDNNPIQAIFNYENDIIQKTYWIDGSKQTRFLNTKHSIENGDNEELIDINSNTINLVGNFDLNQAVVTGQSSGGTHTAGMIQYSYNLYRLNSAQTKRSPLTNLYPLDKGYNLGGGDVNESVGTIPIIKISNIDLEYTHIKIYAVKYTSYNELPSIDMIYHAELSGDNEVIYYDDGDTIESVSLEEFLFLGSDPIIPKHIETKDNILFSSNLKEIAFDVDLDCRAFSFKADQTGIVWDKVVPSGTWVTGNSQSFTPGNYSNIGEKSDAVNSDYNTQKYQSDGSTVGGEGVYVKYALVSTPRTDDEAKGLSLFKDDEIYRAGVQFYNKLGQTSFPKWIADIKAPITNFTGSYTTLRVDLKPEFIAWLNNSDNFESENDKPVGYRIIRADRQIGDRSILCQGLLSGMMARTTEDPGAYDYWNDYVNKREASNNLIKFPQPISRTFDSSFAPFKSTSHLSNMQFSGNSGDHHPTEIWEATDTSDKRQHAWQYTKMMQMYSPEVLFNTGLSLGAGLKLDIIGLAKNTRNDYWYKRINTGSLSIEMSRRYENIGTMLNDPDVYWLGIFGPANQENVTDQLQVNREYGTFIPTVNTVNRSIYGSPETTERGQGSTSYNNDGELKFNNSMSQIASDQGENTEAQRAITSMNSYGARCLTIVEGGDSNTLDQRKGLESLHALTGISETDGVLIGEIRIEAVNVYLGNLYGGNTYEAKQRNTYLEIGNYNKVNNLTSNITSPGDTFVYNFEVARVSKTDTEKIDNQTLLLTDIVSFKCESTVDMKNRSDQSIFDWDSEFQPTYDEYHDYNRVYSQQPSLVQNVNEDFTFKRVKSFDARIIASAVKVPGEPIDSWTDFRINEVMDVDGKYGPINAIINYGDEIYTFQDLGVAKISINPRIQVQAGDGIGIELGTGNVLYNYQYVTTSSGSINKWGITTTPSGIYYYDGLNKSFNRFRGKNIEILSTIKGMHSFLENNSTYSSIKQDNPLQSAGVLASYDHINNDVYLTLHQDDNSFTVSFNEKADTFVSFYDFHPTMYISKGFRLYTVNNDQNGVWEHFNGNYNNFYGTQYETKLTLIVNPQDKDCVFNNIDWKSKVYDPSIIPLGNNPIETDVYNETLTSLQAYNEYQYTKVTPLTLNSNLRRKFRVWSANIPRALDASGNPSLDRMRGHWVYIDLIFDPDGNRRLVLDDIGINYTSH